MILAAALVLQIATATPAPVPKLTGGFGRPPATATAKARIVITDVGIPRYAAPALPAAQPAAVQGSSADADWRGRVTRLRADLDAAEADLATQSAGLTVVTHGSPGRDHFMLMAIRDAALAAPRAKVNELRREVARLPEDCRTTPGCQPGWVR